MDWKYISSLRTNHIKDEEKDALLNTIAWYDIDVDEVDFKKCVKLLKISQEIMKFKSEQVEALVAELDEVAKRQAEDEMKRSEGDLDAKSVRSRKSSSVDLDEMEGKYREVKHKLKQQNKSNEKLKNEIEKMKQQIKTLEQDRNHLQNELQLLQRDDAQSDISESVKDQHRELVESISQKNKQISQLLNDLEMIETDNIKLKEQLITVRDKLSDATGQINKMTDRFLSNKVEIEEKTATIENFSRQVEALKLQIDDIDAEKENYKKQLEDFAIEIDSRVDEWKRIIDEKNDEIKELKLKATPEEKSKSSESIESKDFRGQISTLNKIVIDRDNKVHELQKALQTATEEMKETTLTLHRLMEEKEVNVQHLNSQQELNKDLKGQLKNNHQRCQDLQEEVKYLQKLSEKKDKDINDIICNFKDNDKIELSEFLEKIQNLKSQKRSKDKHISELVRKLNKLQDVFEQIERENQELRARLGLSEDDTVSVASVLTKQKKQKKLLQELQSKANKLEEDKLTLRFEVQKQNKMIHSLTKQLNELDAIPLVDEEDLESNEISEGEKLILSSHDGITKESHHAVVEENEALRKGLHEILESLQTRTEKGCREMKSETLEQLLKALDVKHIAGWYHPAMRLQAEVHTLQGSNAELREQLKIARMELKNLKSEETSNNSNEKLFPRFEYPTLVSKSDSEAVADLNHHLSNVLKEYNVQKEQNKILFEKLEKYKFDFDSTQQQMVLLYQQHLNDKAEWNKDKENFTITTNEVTEKVDVLEAKLKEISKYNLSTDEEVKMRQVSEMAGTLVVLNRKSLFLENENVKLLSDLKNVKSDLLNAQVVVMERMNKLSEEKKYLLHKIEILENNLKNKMDSTLYIKLQADFDDVTLKYREALNNLNEICAKDRTDFELLQEKVELLKSEKKELLHKIQELVTKIISFEISSFEVEKATEILTKKLSQSEVNEITERQRANHMNNLYELVKEQLKKSEERHKEFEKYNREIMQKNLNLQESLKENQNKIINEINSEEYDDIKDKYEKALDEKQDLATELNNLKINSETVEKINQTQKIWSSAQEYELLSLKHQILDLQATTDDKAVISRLSTDVVHARLLEAESRKKIDALQKELTEVESEYDDYKSRKEKDLEIKTKSIENQENKITSLQEVIKQQRQQYYGYIPLISESKFIENVLQIYNEKHSAFLKVQNCESIENETEIIREQLKEQIKEIEDIKSTKSADLPAKITKWYNDKCLIQLQELKYRRKSEFIQTQLCQALEKIKLQDQHTFKLEEALLEAYQKSYIDVPNSLDTVKLQPAQEKPAEKVPPSIPKEENVKVFKSEEAQTIFDPDHVNDGDDHALEKIQMELIETQKQVFAKEESVEQLKSKVTELEMNISLFKNQLGDKQSQITFYEKHIMELQNKKEILAQDGMDEIDLSSNEECAALKTTVTKLQNLLLQKEEAILKYQSLLKQDRDEHSLAAERMQEELKRLQNVLITHQQAYKELKECQKEAHPGRVAVEQYIKQVHALEKHTAELHTAVITLETQLQTSREENVRWRGLANDRLQSIETLRKEMEETHRSEIQVYKDDCEKWREEVLTLKAFVSKHQGSLMDKSADLQKLMKEKDDRIHELTVHLRQLKMESRKRFEIPESPKVQELEAERELLIKELEGLKKRHEALLNKEKNAREEIRNLKGQLMKRPVTSARSDKSDMVRDQLLKKVSLLENDNSELRENLQQQLIINETHRIKVAEDFDKWNKQKFFQQTAEKLKLKLREKSDEFEKLQQTCSGYRILIERLEREKHALETKNKNLRINTTNTAPVKLEMLEIENAKLQAEIEAVTAKLEMQQHHAGALGAAMLQEKLQAQERKIAVLELAAKGSSEIRAEIERLQVTVASLQKLNLRLEAENLEFKIDLEKSTKELPHLREQIQHLENYIEVLKSEQSANHEVSNCGDHAAPEPKKISELERTVFVLKRIVEKLQAENKRLQGGGRICNEKISGDTIRRDFYKLKDQYGDSIQKIARLEDELNAANSKLKQMKSRTQFMQELDEVKDQLAQKTELLEKVKVLLHRAATKEKALLSEITRLKAVVTCNTSSASN